jgi:TolB-like protein
MNRFLENLQRQAEENPVLAMGVAAALITAISRLNDSRVNAKNSHAWAKEIDRRVKAAKL